MLENLKMMHFLKMTHRDVKEKNIGWSPHFKKWVFLDFGFSKIMKTEIGYQVWAKFIGTYQYTIKELQDAHRLKKAQIVDFYWNDLNGLIISLKTLKEKKFHESDIFEYDNNDS